MSTIIVLRYGSKVKNCGFSACLFSCEILTSFPLLFTTTESAYFWGMNLLIRPPVQWHTQTLRLPASKSYSTRLLALSFLSKGRISPGHISDCGDVKDFAQFLSVLGGKQKNQTQLFAGDGAAVARFGLAIAAAQRGSYSLDGTPQLRRRPMGILVDALRSLGADIQYAAASGHLPLIIHGKKLRGGGISIPSSESSQYASALAMLGSILPSPLFLHLEGDPVSLPYLDLSLTLLSAAGIDAQRAGADVEIYPGRFRSLQIDAPADWSAASFAFALHSLSASPELQLPGLTPDSGQADVDAIQHFAFFGVDSVFSESGFLLKKIPTFPNSFEADLRNSPDLLPPLAISAAGNGIAAIFTGLPHLSHKESNRIDALRKGLHQVGIQTESGNDWLRIIPGGLKEGCFTIDSFGDHRIAMAFSLLSIKCGAAVIKQAECVEKSWPGWWDALRLLGFKVVETKEG